MQCASELSEVNSLAWLQPEFGIAPAGEFRPGIDMGLVDAVQGIGNLGVMRQSGLEDHLQPER